MTTMRRTILALTLSALGCGTIEIGDLNPDRFTNLGGSGGGNCDGVSAAFVPDVIPIFTQKSCATGGCHGSGDAGGGLNLDVDEESDGAAGIRIALLEGRVDTADPAESLVLRKPLGQLSHGGGAPFSSVSDSAYRTIFCWIEAGALE